MDGKYFPPRALQFFMPALRPAALGTVSCISHRIFYSASSFQCARSPCWKPIRSGPSSFSDW